MTVKVWYLSQGDAFTFDNTKTKVMSLEPMTFYMTTAFLIRKLRLMLAREREYYLRHEII